MNRDVSPAALADLIDTALPQTQCRRCGYDDCRAYAEAVARGGAGIDRCPPGGVEGIARLAAITGRPVVPLDPAVGSEEPLAVARVDEAWCIGCTLCIAACPVDCIVGAPKRMHTVVASQCTGCGLCLPACPVDCIAMVGRPGADPTATGWAAWSEAQATAARERHDFRRLRLAAAREAASAPAGTRPSPGAPSPETKPPVHGMPPPREASPAASDAAVPPGAGARPSAQPPGATDAPPVPADAAARLRIEVAAAIERARRSRGA